MKCPLCEGTIDNPWDTEHIDRADCVSFLKDRIKTLEDSFRKEKHLPTRSPILNDHLNNKKVK